MAILADTDAKQNRHEKDLRDALVHQATFHAADLLLMEGYPPGKRFGTFYGQSASLTRFLVARKGPQQFVQFVERADEVGIGVALQECYGFPSIAELDHQWRQDIPKVQRSHDRDGVISSVPVQLTSQASRLTDVSKTQ
jgi:hypothetical protein